MPGLRVPSRGPGELVVRLVEVVVGDVQDARRLPCPALLAPDAPDVERPRDGCRSITPI